MDENAALAPVADRLRQYPNVEATAADALAAARVLVDAVRRHERGGADNSLAPIERRADMQDRLDELAKAMRAVERLIGTPGKRDRLQEATCTALLHGRDLWETPDLRTAGRLGRFLDDVPSFTATIDLVARRLHLAGRGRRGIDDAMSMPMPMFICAMTGLLHQRLDGGGRFPAPGNPHWQAMVDAIWQVITGDVRDVAGNGAAVWADPMQRASARLGFTGAGDAGDVFPADVVARIEAEQAVRHVLTTLKVDDSS